MTIFTNQAKTKKEGEGDSLKSKWGTTIEASAREAESTHIATLYNSYFKLDFWKYLTYGHYRYAMAFINFEIGWQNRTINKWTDFWLTSDDVVRKIIENRPVWKKLEANQRRKNKKINFEKAKPIIEAKIQECKRLLKGGANGIKENYRGYKV